MVMRHGAPGRSRTCDHRLRRPVLYPSELQARSTVPVQLKGCIPPWSDVPASTCFASQSCFARKPRPSHPWTWPFGGMDVHWTSIYFRLTPVSALGGTNIHRMFVSMPPRPSELQARSTVPVQLMGCIPFPVAHTKIGRGRGIRTPDNLLPKQVRYQAAPCPVSATIVPGVTHGGQA